MVVGVLSHTHKCACVCKREMLTEDWSGEKHHLNYTSMMYWLCFSVSLSFFCWGKTSFPQSWCVGYQYGKGHVALVTFLTERKLGGDPDLACLVAACLCPWPFHFSHSGPLVWWKIHLLIYAYLLGQCACYRAYLFFAEINCIPAS